MQTLRAWFIHLKLHIAYIKREGKGPLQGRKDSIQVYVLIRTSALLNQMETQHAEQRVITLNGVILHLMEFHCFQWRSITFAGLTLTPTEVLLYAISYNFLSILEYWCRVWSYDVQNNLRTAKTKIDLGNNVFLWIYAVWRWKRCTWAS